MALKSQEKIIGDHTYVAHQLPAKRAERVFIKICKIAGPSLVGVLAGSLAAGAGRGGEKKPADPGKTDLALDGLPEAAAALFDRLTELEWDQLRDVLLESVLVDGKPMLTGYDLVYAGRLTEVLQVLWFSLEVNFGFTSGSLVNALGIVRPIASAASPSDSPRPSAAAS